MVIDTSAILAILQDEPERGHFTTAIAEADGCPASNLTASLVRLGPGATPGCRGFLDRRSGGAASDGIAHLADHDCRTRAASRSRWLRSGTLVARRAASA